MLSVLVESIDDHLRVGKFASHTQMRLGVTPTVSTVFLIVIIPSYCVPLPLSYPVYYDLHLNSRIIELHPTGER